MQRVWCLTNSVDSSTMHTLCQELYILALLVMCVVKIRLYMAWGGSVQSASTMTSVPLAIWVANTSQSMRLCDLTVWEIGMCAFFFFLDKLYMQYMMYVLYYFGVGQNKLAIHFFAMWKNLNVNLEFIDKELHLSNTYYPSPLVWATVSNCHFSLSLTQR